MVGPFREALGQYLKRERESRGISLEEAARTTRIGLPYLEALERDDFNFFPQKDFILGFLKGYSRHLGLNVEEVLKRYRLQAELASRKETFHQIPLFRPPGAPEEESGETEPSVPHPSVRRKPILPWKILLQALVIAAALSASWYLHQLLKHSPQERKSAPVEVSSERGKGSAEYKGKEK